MVSVDCLQPASKMMKVLCTSNGPAESDLDSTSDAFLMLDSRQQSSVPRPSLTGLSGRVPNVMGKVVEQQGTRTT